MKPKWLIYILSGIGFLFSLLLLLIGLVWLGYFGAVPGSDELRLIQDQKVSLLVTSDGQRIGTYPNQEGIEVNLDDVSPDLINALLAIEDIRFYRHNGIDYRALGRVFFRTILFRQNTGGGSTITQQIAKNLYPRSNYRGIYLLTDKLREMIIASRLESIYSKEELLMIYLNRVSFGENTFGIDMAAHRFFNKPASELTLTESATLAGQLKATTFYNPHRNTIRSEQRRNVVIRQMEKYDMISTEIADSAVVEPLQTDYSRRVNRQDKALYFKNYLETQIKNILQLSPSLDGNKYNLETDALTIYTTLDSRIQEAAELAVSSHMQELQSILDKEILNHTIFMESGDPDVLLAWQQSGYYRELLRDGFSTEEIDDLLHTPVSTILFSWNGYVEKELSPYDELRYYLSFLNAGLLVMHPNTGHILGWVGGIDSRHFPYDQILAVRQSGSTFKPIVYAAALEEGFVPCDYERNQLTTFADYSDWTPRNSEDEYGGYYSLQAALAKSVNTATVQLGMNIGIPSIQRTARAMGIESRIPSSPSIVLGTSETTLLELTTAYTSFLNEGQPTSPKIITRIFNSDGELIYDFTTDDSVTLSFDHISDLSGQIDGENQLNITDRKTGNPQGISPETASTMVKMLEKAVNEGTGSPLRTRFGITHALAGKTGTTQDYADGWFIGFTPEMVFGVRVGGWNQRVHFREFPGFASQTALPIVGNFLTSIGSGDDRSSLPNQFPSHLIDSPYDFSCSDYQNDKFKDRLRNFFRGRSSDDAVIVEEDDEKKSRNIFRRLGRKLGISDN